MQIKSHIKEKKKNTWGRRFCKEKVRISCEKSEVRLRIFSLEVLKHKGLGESLCQPGSRPCPHRASLCEKQKPTSAKHDAAAEIFPGLPPPARAAETLRAPGLSFSAGLPSGEVQPQPNGTAGQGKMQL